VFLEDFPYFFENLVRVHLGIDIVVLVELSVVLNDLLGLVFISHQPLFDTFNVIVSPPAGLSSLQQSVYHHFLFALQMQYEGQVDLIVH
jgi:hypothetical protein